MRIKRKELLAALKRLEAGLASREIIQQSNRFCFEESTIRTYNDNVSVIVPFVTGIKGAFPSKELLNIATKFPDDELDISMGKDDGYVMIKGRGRKATLRIDATVKLPEIDIAGIKRWLDLPSNFLDAITFCLFSVGKNTNRPELMCLYVTDDEVQTLDSQRATRYTLDGVVKKPFLLPREVVKPLSIFNPVRYTKRECWIHFADDAGAVFSCRTIEEDFPDIKEFFDIQADREIELPINFNDVVDRSHILQSDEEKKVKIVLSKGSVTVEGIGGKGEVSERVKMDYDGPEMSVFVNPVLLSAILQHLKRCSIGQDKIVFNGSNFVHLVCVGVDSGEGNKEDE